MIKKFKNFNFYDGFLTPTLLSSSWIGRPEFYVFALWISYSPHCEFG